MWTSILLTLSSWAGRSRSHSALYLIFQKASSLTPARKSSKTWAFQTSGDTVWSNSSAWMEVQLPVSVVMTSFVTSSESLLRNTWARDLKSILKKKRSSQVSHKKANSKLFRKLAASQRNTFGKSYLAQIKSMISPWLISWIWDFHRNRQRQLLNSLRTTL